MPSAKSLRRLRRHLSHRRGGLINAPTDIGIFISNDNENIRRTQAISGGNGLTLQKFNDFQTILTAAEAYFHLGYAVIPLLGDFDPARPKVAARSWSVYQQRAATLDEIYSWFTAEGEAGALGIVTGRVSRLVVLDFDSPDLFADFRRRFPDLIETRTVQSAGRGLPHLYFHVPGHLHIASQKRQGVDLLSDGRYVVAPPTCINGQPYRITRGGMPRRLTEHDIKRLQSFMADQRSPAPAPFHHEVLPISERLSPCATLQPSALPKHLPIRSDLHGLYYYWRTKTARNEALFRTAIYARDHGWDQSQTRQALAVLHTSQTGSNTERETQAIRQREAYATIRSAFSRPARVITALPTKPRAGCENALPNSIREALMQRKQTYVIRTLEGLFLTGFRAGRGITAEQAIRSLSGIVGRDSIYKALKALAPNGQPIFPQRSPSALPGASKEAANQKQPLKTKKCFFVTEKKSGMKKKGGQQRVYKMPHIKDLYKLLGVKPSSSDPLTRDDLQSAHQTRMALHRELIKRRPGEYSRRWLANRLGVSRRTINTYNQRIPIHTRPTYQETNLSWVSIDKLLGDEALEGAFIETLTGKKYPALRSVASHLLAKGTFIRLKQRASNLYWYGSDDPPPDILPKFNPEELNQPDIEDIAIKAARDYANRAYPMMAYPEAPPQPSSASDEGSRTDALTAHSPSHLVEDALSHTPSRLSPVQQEALAQTLYSHINDLSLKNARQIASRYTEKNIHFALQRLQQRTNLANPSGFFVSILRSTARENEAFR